MAITDAEKQEIIDELLAEIRANGLDYSGQTITFPDAFNVTQTERQNVKIPAIDERKSTVVHGNVDLEALLTAYGVTHVEEIASEVSSSYMKKTANSNLNMNGYNVSGVKMSNSFTPLGYTAPYAELPQLSYATLGLSDHPSFEGFMTAWTLKVREIYGTAINVRGKVLVDVSYGYGDIWGWVSSAYDALGATSFCCVYQDYYPGQTIFIYRKNASDTIHVEQYPTFPYGDTTRDNRINAYGSSDDGYRHYLRFENGIQICWGTSTVTIPTTTSWGSLYLSNITTSISFPLAFSELQFANVNFLNTSSTYATMRVYASNANIYQIEAIRPTALEERTDYIKYFAIGKWK